MSSPDWWVRDARRPKGGGAVEQKGRGQREVSSLLFESLENQGVSEGLLLSARAHTLPLTCVAGEHVRTFIGQ